MSSLVYIHVSPVYKNDGISISMYRFFDRSRENLSRGGARDYSRDSLGLRDGSEMVVDACVKGKHAGGADLCSL